MSYDERRVKLIKCLDNRKNFLIILYELIGGALSIYIKYVTHNIVKMTREEELPISRLKRQKLREKLEESVL